ncbi:MAG: glycogen/starch synthase [Candidatus Falkowbacteria bacterium]
MPKMLNIVSIASEIAPFAKTGGLADVARSLPKALRRLGHQVIVVMPFYGKIIDCKEHNLISLHKDVVISIAGKEIGVVNFWQGYLMNGLPIYFVEHKKFFSQRKQLYGYPRENARFMLFDAAVLRLLTLLKYPADIIHCHDWQTGLVPYLLKTDYRYSKILQNAKSIYTIHNLVFQLGHNWWEVPPENKDFGKKQLPDINSTEIEYINFAKRGILNADIVNTVSEQYREEIMTKHFGQDLDKILRSRENSLYGIINGIDYKAFNPSVDKSLHRNFDHRKIHRKKLNKQHLQQQFGLPIDVDIPLFCTTSRVTFQKGFKLISELMDQIMHHDVQMIILGAGDKQYIKELKKKAKRFPKKLVVIPSHEQTLRYETSVYAGADFFLLPSHQEPCGINQLKAMRYGCIPIVRRVGGLHDTVKNYNPKLQNGTGFTFNQFDVWGLYEAIIRALESSKYKNEWRNLVVRAMKQSNSWELPAQKYITLYRKALIIGDKKS